MEDYRETLERTRDIIKKSAFGVEFVVLGIENQKKIHYAMPLRNMIYDGLSYLKEYRTLTGDRKNQTKDEFLSKMRRGERLHPVVTLVIYYSEKEWDGPFSLKDMVVEMPEKIEKIFSDYRMNLLQVRKSGTYRFRNPDVETVFEISRDIFEKKFEEIWKKYGSRDIDSELLGMIGKITESRELLEQAERKESVNMCTALEELKAEGRQEGRQEGLQEGLQEGRQMEKKEMAVSLAGMGFPLEKIAEAAKVDVSLVRQWIGESSSGHETD